MSLPFFPADDEAQAHLSFFFLEEMACAASFFFSPADDNMIDGFPYVSDLSLLGLHRLHPCQQAFIDQSFCG